MNAVQELIANATGLRDIVENQQVVLGELTEAQEHLIADNAMLRREIEDLDYLNLWDPSQAMEIIPIRDRAAALARLRRLRHDNPLAKQSIKLITRFVLGKGIQWTVAPVESEVPASDDAGPSPELPAGADGTTPSRTPSLAAPTKFVQLPRAARSRQEAVDPDVENDPTRKIIEAFWEDDENKYAFTTTEGMKQLVDDVATDGEKFHLAFESQSEPYLRVAEVPVEEIKQIIYNPDNKLQPVLYRRQYIDSKYNAERETYEPQGDPKNVYYMDYRITEERWTELKQKINVPEGKIVKGTDGAYVRIFHCGINWLWGKGGRRGVSELYASREWFRVFREFMEGRAAINQAAQAISYKRKIKGGPAAVASFGGKFGGLPVGQTAGSDSNELGKLSKPVPGAIYDSNEAIDLDWMKTDTGAQNAKEDGRMLLMSAGAGVGTFIHYFGEGGDANLATAQSMELPMVKNYEDWQQWIEDFLKNWFLYLLRIATDADSAKQEIKRVGFIFPPIISQDVVKYTTSWSQIVRDIAPNNMVVRREAIRGALSIMQVSNIDALMPEIEAEMAKAETQRLQQQQQMLTLASSMGDPTKNGNGNGNGGNPFKKDPTSGMDPNLKKLASGTGPKVSNGPKPE